MQKASSKDSMTDSYEIMNCVSEWLKVIEMKKFFNDGMFLQTRITFLICQNKNISTTRTNGDSIPISRVLRHPTIEKSFWFQASAVYLGKTSPRYLFLQAPKMAVGTEFAFYMVELASFLVIFLKIRKSRRRQTKSWEWTILTTSAQLDCNIQKDLHIWYCAWVVKPSDKTHDTNDDVTIKTL